MKDACELCGSTALDLYGSSMYHHRDRAYDLCKCGRCSLVQVGPLPTEDEVASLYGDDYFEKDYDSLLSQEDYFHNQHKLDSRYNGILDNLERWHPRGDLLEIGCAGGFFLDIARKRGWNVRGVEITDVGHAHATGELGLDVHHGSFPPAPFADESFDVVYAGHVVEHMRHPVAGFADMNRMLRPGGVLLIEVPTYVDSFYFRTLRRAVPVLNGLGVETGPILRALKFPRPGETIPPFHLYEFRRATLVALFRRFDHAILQVVQRVPKPDRLETEPGLRNRLLNFAFDTLDFGARKCGLPGGNIGVYGRKPE